MMAFPAVAAVLIGGAKRQKSHCLALRPQVRVLFQTLLTIALPGPGAS